MKTRNCGYFKEILNGTVGLVHGIGLISIRLSWDLMAAWNGDWVIEIWGDLMVFSWYLVYFGNIVQKVLFAQIKCSTAQDALYMSI